MECTLERGHFHSVITTVTVTLHPAEYLPDV
jgi:hypothetical protein